MVAVLSCLDRFAGWKTGSGVSMEDEVGAMFSIE